MRNRIVLIAAILAVAGCDALERIAGPATLVGVVRSLATGEVLAGATVTADGVEATSDEDGKFTLPGLPAGPVDVLVVREGYENTTQPVTLVAGMDTTEIRMMPAFNAGTRVDSLKFFPSQNPVRITSAGSVRIQVMAYGTTRVINGDPSDTSSIVVTATPPLSATWQVSDALRDVVVSANGEGTGTVTVSYNGKSASISVSAEAVKFKAFSVSYGYGCGVALDDTAWCWGGNASAELGTNTLATCVGSACQYATNYGNGTPLPVIGDHEFVQVAAIGISCSQGSGFTIGTCGGTCGLTAAGEAWCWGEGVGLTPTRMETGASVASLAMIPGSYPWLRARSCGLRTDGRVVCFTVKSSAPIADGMTFQSFQFGRDYYCGISAGDIYCAGRNAITSGYELVDTVSYQDPTRISAQSTFTTLDAGRTSICALDTTGALQCFNWCPSTNSSCVMTPQPVPGGRTYTAISEDDDGPGMCAITTAGEVDCWADIAKTPGSPVLPEAAVAIGASVGQSCALAASGYLYCWDETLTVKKLPGQ